MTRTEPVGSDDALLSQARSGDRAALDALVTRYEPRVFRFGLGLCRDADAAQDVLQDTFLAMVRSLNTFRADASFSTWLYAIARHACLRKRRRRVSAPKEVASLDSLSAGERQRLAASTPTPEDRLSARELRAALSTAIGSLARPHREVLLLRDVEGLTALETATVLGVTVAAVKSRLHRARLAVREALSSTLGAMPPQHGRYDLLRHFSEHLEGDLSADLCARMEAHLAQCPPCREGCASLKLMLALCKTDAPALTESTRQRLRRAIDACLSGSDARAASGRPHVAPLQRDSR
jgi:RNA polymerase sigma-70 factor (ECF subfamily)